MAKTRDFAEVIRAQLADDPKLAAEVEEARQELLKEVAAYKRRRDTKIFLWGLFGALVWAIFSAIAMATLARGEEPPPIVFDGPPAIQFPVPIPTPTVPAEPRKAPQPTFVDGWHYVLVGEKLAAGNHWHACQCGRGCQHDDGSFGSQADHTCVCGRVNWNKGTPKRWLPPNSVPVKPVSVIQEYCPPGRT